MCVSNTSLPWYRAGCTEHYSSQERRWELAHDHKETSVPKNRCVWTVALEKTLESPLEIQPVNPKLGNQFRILTWKDWSWSWSSNTLATWSEELTHWKRLWSWERLRAGGEGDIRGWDGWMASPAQWTWVRANSEGPGSLEGCSPRDRRVRCALVTEQLRTEFWGWKHPGKVSMLTWVYGTHHQMPAPQCRMAFPAHVPAGSYQL